MNEVLFNLIAYIVLYELFIIFSSYVYCLFDNDKGGEVYSRERGLYSLYL